MKRYARLLSILLAIIMVAGLLPLSVIAEDIQSTHTVQFKLNYNGAGKIATQTVADGECATEPENAVREGWILKGWYTKKNGGEKFDFATPITADVTLYAQWDEDIEHWGRIWGNNIIGMIEKAEEEEEEIPDDKEEDNTPETPDGEFVLTVSENRVLLDDVYTIYFHSEISSATESVVLYDVTVPSEKKQIGEMFDDGKYSLHGDDIAGDGIYSIRYSTTECSEGSKKFIAECGDSSSNTLEVSFYNIISDEILDITADANEKIRDLTDSETFKNKSLDERKILAEKLIEELISSGSVIGESVYYSEDSKMYSFSFTGEFLGGIALEEFDSDFNGYGNSDDNISNIKYAVSKSNNSSDTVEDLGSALILNSFPAFETNSQDISYRTDFYREIKKDWDKKGLKTTLLDTNVKVSDYEDLSKYNVVVVATHGNVYEWNDGFLWLNHHERPAFCLAEKSTKAKDKEYSVDLKDKAIATVNGRYYVLPEYFENNYASHSFENTFVFSESCCSLGMNMEYNYSMSNVFISCGAKAYIGFHNSVLATYSREFMKEYVDCLIDGSTSLEAYNAAILKMGANHQVWFENTYGYTLRHYYEHVKNPTETFVPSLHVAYPSRFGKNSATLVYTGIRNGDFEQSYPAYIEIFDKAPRYWTIEGDARLLKKLGEVMPYGTNSEQMAIITTGVGSKTTSNIGGTEGSYISQKFTVPEYATTLKFDYNFISEEPMEFVGSVYDDAFGIQIVQKGAVVEEKIFESINTSEWYDVSGIDFAGGDSTVYQTKWKSTTVDISKYAGEIITLYFIIYDVGDSEYDSVCVLDNIVIE